MAGLDNNISNIIGKKLPQWVLNQLETRANQNSKDSRDNDNILYLANKTAWVRLVSSINISQSDQNYFKGILGVSNIIDAESLAKEFILFGGTSKYLNKDSYKQRSGLGKDGAYGILGTKEIQDFGYRPMPGITSVNIDTQGRLGSVRSATINFKCWDKSQLDIIDTLYFKLGFTMFLEWGHTFYYPSKTNKIKSTEEYAIDPFQKNLTKEEISFQIAKSSRASEGNYDAMLGMVTNFNFSYNQEGGYDCTLKIIALGALGDSIKINNAGVLPNLLEEEILLYNDTLNRITQDLAAKAAAAANVANIPKLPPKIDQLKADDFFNTYIKPNANPGSNTSAVQTNAPRGGIALQNNISAGLNSKYTGGYITLNGLDKESYQTIDATFSTPAYGPVYFIRRQKGFIPFREDYIKSVKVTLDTARILKNINNTVIDGVRGFEDDKAWDFPGNYLDKAKLIVFNQPVTSIKKFFDSLSVQNLLNAFATSQVESSIKTGTTELDKVGDFASYNTTYDVKGGTGIIYDIKIERKLWGVSDRTDIVGYVGGNNSGPSFTKSAYSYISTEEFIPEFKKLLESKAPFNVVSITSGNNKTTTVLSIIMPITKESFSIIAGGEETQQTQPDGTIKKIPKSKPTYKKENVTFQLAVEISIDDSSLISSITVSDTNVIEPLDFAAQKKLVAQDVKEVDTKEEQKKAQDAITAQIKQAISFQSSLEITLRTIQIHALNQAINKSGNDLEIGRKVYKLDMLDSNQRKFTNQIFTNGIFTSFLDELLPSKEFPSGKINDSIYKDENTKVPSADRLKIYSKYGFATSLLGNKANIDTIEPTNFSQILNAYVVPYQINQEIIKGVSTNHPVYIPLSLLLMILNHTCTIYDTKNNDLQTPLVYLDFNTEINFCLSNPKQLTTNPWVTLIPFEGSNSDFAQLFDSNVLEKNNTQISAVSGSTEVVKLYKPETEDLLSGNLPPIKFDTIEISNPYRGKVMNILLNIDYLVKLVEEYSQKNGTNSVYLKTFLEQILSDLNKYLGKFNAFRLAYNDGANTFQIVDDQFLPALNGEDQVTPDNRKDTPNTDNRTGLPLYGKTSIAKSLEIKTEISNKLGNMIAISANSTVSNKATLSTNGDAVGYINTSYVDRYIPDALEPTGSGGAKINLDTIKTSAAQFNQTIIDFYSKINPSENSVGHATNYYIDKMSKIKNEDFATRAAPMIPVSVNFTTDGISGMGMGHAFTIPDQLLPYTYSTRNSLQNLDPKEKDSINKVGFVMIGLTHTIESNQWNTAVRANMIFLKDKTDFKGEVIKLSPKDEVFGVDVNNFTTVNNIQQTNFVAQNNEGKTSAEKYLGRTLTDDEWNQLVRATFAEASGNQTERAYVMGVILNRVRTNFGNYGRTITAQLTAKNQFQAVTGTAYEPGPSINYKTGPNNSAADSIYGAAVNILSQVPKNYLSFTSALPSAYGKGTNIGFIQTLLNKGGQRIGDTIFA